MPTCPKGSAAVSRRVCSRQFVPVGRSVGRLPQLAVQHGIEDIAKFRRAVVEVVLISVPHVFREHRGLQQPEHLRLLAGLQVEFLGPPRRFCAR